MNIRITVEQMVDGQWQTITKTTNENVWKDFINLSAFCKLLKITRGQLRYRMK